MLRVSQYLPLFTIAAILTYRNAFGRRSQLSPSRLRNSSGGRATLIAIRRASISHVDPGSRLGTQ
jgi:hypothetical protein